MVFVGETTPFIGSQAKTISWSLILKTRTRVLTGTLAFVLFYPLTVSVNTSPISSNRPALVIVRTRVNGFRGCEVARIPAPASRSSRRNSPTPFASQVVHFQPRLDRIRPCRFAYCKPKVEGFGPGFTLHKRNWVSAKTALRAESAVSDRSEFTSLSSRILFIINYLHY